MSDEADRDPVSARRNALAALVRSFAWPVVALIAMYFFSDTVNIIARSSQKVSFAGLAIERFVNENTLSEKQLDMIKNLSPDEIIQFFSQYSVDGRNCYSEEGLPPSHQSYLDAGLIKFKEGECGSSDGYYELTSEGTRLRSALGSFIADALRNSLN